MQRIHTALTLVYTKESSSPQMILNHLFDNLQVVLTWGLILPFELLVEEKQNLKTAS